ncbi:MAG: hypothetical protein JXR05_02585 [Flavobacteriaceae bacterium]
MLKKISNLGSSLSKEELKAINGGIFPIFDCCSCVYRPEGYMYQVFLTQSCSIPCPVDGDPLTYGDGC